MIYRLFYKGEYVLFKAESEPIGIIKAKKEIDTIDLINYYERDLEKVMDSYDLETYVKGFLTWLVNAKKAERVLDSNDEREVNVVSFSNSRHPLFFYTHY